MAEAGRNLVKAGLEVPAARARQVAAFVRRRGLPIRVVRGGPCRVRVVEASGRRACSTRTLYIGGWITCPAARAVAARLGMRGRQAGALLDLLDIKIRECELGCF